MVSTGADRNQLGARYLKVLTLQRGSVALPLVCCKF